MNRRSFIKTAGLLGVATVAPLHGYARVWTPKKGDRDPVALLQDLVEEAVDAGADYADARFVRLRTQSLQVRKDYLYSVTNNDSMGVNLRVHVRGAWASVSTRYPAPVDPEAMAREACALAGEAAGPDRIPFSTEGRISDTSVRWQGPCTVNPFDIPLKEKKDFLLSILRPAANNKNVAYAVSNLFQVRRESIFVSSLDATAEQTSTITYPNFAVTAFDQRTGRIDSRSGSREARLGGWELATTGTFETEVWQAADEALEMQAARPVEPGSYDLVLAPSHMRRVLLETLLPHLDPLSLAGLDGDNPVANVFTLDRLAESRAGSPLLNISWDTAMEGGLASCGWDDTGRPAATYPIVEQGRITGIPGSDELNAITAPWRGAWSRAGGWQSAPRFSMPNIAVAPADEDTTLEALIQSTEKGLLIEGRGSMTHSINRRYFHAGGQRVWRIENGKKAGMVRDAEYEASLESFWSSLNALGGASTLETGGDLFPNTVNPQWEVPFSLRVPAAKFVSVAVVPPQEEKR
ncbi:MAG: TldD/PmbA family protein [Ignavibacteriae bacterium]|nr:TldD/PmbA family protein [Ignavibacteriota bacterium]